MEFIHLDKDEFLYITNYDNENYLLKSIYERYAIKLAKGE